MGPGHEYEDLSRQAPDEAIASRFPSPAGGAEVWRRRLAALSGDPGLHPGADAISPAALGQMTSGDPRGDGFHRLNMDLHRALGAVESRLAEETVEGARVFGLRDEDRPLVAAFMRGVARTEDLKSSTPASARRRRGAERA